MKNQVTKSKNRSFGEAGVIHTLLGNTVNLADVRPEDLHMADIATSLHQIMRFNGHAYRGYSVLSHSMVMCDMAEPEFKMEALLHDAGEAYLGDIIVPVKEMFPDIALFENEVTALIMDKFSAGYKVNTRNGTYNKSPYISSLDRRLGRGEHAILRPIWGAEIDEEVAVKMYEFWDKTPNDFLNMYDSLLERDGNHSE